MRYRHCIFDLYGTLVDIHTDERSPRLWVRMAEAYRRHGAIYQPGELRDAYFRLVDELERNAPRQADDHEAHPEIKLEFVFQRLYQEKGVDCGLDTAICIGQLFRRHSTDYLRLYDGAAELLGSLRAQGRGVWLLSNAQAIFTRWELKRLGLDSLFDGVYLSSDYGCKKPDSRFFRTLLEGQGIDPASAVMVGNDGRCDIILLFLLGPAGPENRPHGGGEPAADATLRAAFLPKAGGRRSWSSRRRTARKI